MAYSPSEKYPGAVDVDPDYQGGKFRDNNPSTTNNGSPLKAIDRNELLARDEAIMNDAGFEYSGVADTPQDSQLFKAYKASLGNGANLLSNHNFLIQTPDDSQPLPSATPTSYPPGYQIFSGVFANETTGITNLTYINGRVSFSGGDLYFAVPNTGGIERLTSDQLTASVADFDGKPRTRGVSFALVGDEYRVTVGIDALEDAGATLTPLGSVKFEQGSVATGHESESLSLRNLPDYTDLVFDSVVSAKSSFLVSLGDLIQIKERANAKFNVVSTASVTPNEMDIIVSTQDTSISFQLSVDGATSARALGGKPFDNSVDNSAVMIRTQELNSVESNGFIAFPKGDWFFSSNVPLYVSDTFFGGFESITKGWGTNGGSVNFIWNGAASGNGITIAGISGSKVDPTLNYNIVENSAIKNFHVKPEVDFQINHCIEFDASDQGGTDTDRGYIRNIFLESVSAEKASSHNIVLRGDCFDFKGYNITSRIAGASCFKTVETTVNAGLRTQPDQINLYNPVLFAEKQTGTIDDTKWACDARGTYLFGGNIQGSLGFQCGFGGGCFGTHIEHEEAGPEGSIGVRVVGSWVQVFPKWIVGYDSGFVVGIQSGDLTGVFADIPLIDCKSISGSTALINNAGGARQGSVRIGEIRDASTEYTNYRNLGELEIFINNKNLAGFRQLTQNSTTPSVNRGSKFQTINTTPTVITNFSDARDGDHIIVIFRDNNTTIKVVGNPNFDSSSKQDITPIAFAALEFIYVSAESKWIIVDR